MPEKTRGSCFVVMGFGKKTDFETGRTLDLFGMLLSRSPMGLPARVRLPNGTFAQVAPGLATLQQESAAEANEQYGRP